MHPFTPPLQDLSDDELIEKINVLYGKMRLVMNNPPVYRQMQQLMHDYQLERQARVERKMQEMDKSGLDKKIDIKKWENYHSNGPLAGRA